MHAPMSVPPENSTAVPRRALATCVALVAWLSVLEWKILERLYADPSSREFVLESVRGVLAGTPVSRSWQHRFLAPLLVSALPGGEASALERARLILLVAANLLLFALVVRRGDPGRAPTRALAVVVGYVAGHVLLAYKLEYPWDGVDQLVLLAFGAWVARERPLARFAPLLVVGALNHETILYVPLWYLLSRDRPRVRDGILAAAGVVGVALALRRAFYRGRPNLPGQVYEQALPIADNHLHVAHNLRQLFVNDWTEGRAHVAVGFLGAVVAFGWACRAPRWRRAGAWSLVVLATIVAFGYVNETRHYLVLLAFWVAYGATRAPDPVAPPVPT